MSYEDDISIDEQALDVMWLDQPRLMRRYCDISAEAQRKMGIAKERLDFVHAQLERRVRADPDSFGVVAGARGITEGAIEAAIQVDTEYRQAVRDHLDAKFEAEVATGAVRAFDQRKAALENLVRLLGQAYFAGPVSPRNLHEARQHRDVEAQRAVRVRRRG